MKLLVLLACLVSVPDGVFLFWTEWTSNVDSAGYYEGDYEIVGPGSNPCGFIPIEVECRVVGGAVADGLPDSLLLPCEMGSNTYLPGHSGLICSPGDNDDNDCENYEVRYKCISQSTASFSWSEWISNFDVAGYDVGDWELVAPNSDPCGIQDGFEPEEVQCRVVGGDVEDGLPDSLLLPCVLGSNTYLPGHSGLICSPYANDDYDCENYEVRYKCVSESTGREPCGENGQCLPDTCSCAFGKWKSSLPCPTSGDKCCVPRGKTDVNNWDPCPYP